MRWSILHGTNQGICESEGTSSLLTTSSSSRSLAGCDFIWRLLCECARDQAFQSILFFFSGCVRRSEASSRESIWRGFCDEEVAEMRNGPSRKIQTLSRCDNRVDCRASLSHQVLKGQVHHVRAELDLMSEVDDTNDWVVKLHYSFSDDDFLYLVME